MAELEDTLSYPEWLEWVAFHSLYDLPDAFNTTGQLGSLVSRVAGGKGNPSDFAHIYGAARDPIGRPSAEVRPVKPPNPDHARFLSFVKANAPNKRR